MNIVPVVVQILTCCRTGQTAGDLQLSKKNKKNTFNLLDEASSASLLAESLFKQNTKKNLFCSSFKTYSRKCAKLLNIFLCWIFCFDLLAHQKFKTMS